MNNSSRREELQKYFSTYQFKKPAIMIVVGWLMMSLSGIRGLGVALVIGGIAWIGYQVQRRRTAPSDETVDRWLQEDLEELVKSAHEKMDLVREQVIGKPLIIHSPILWYTHGIDNKDLVYRKGKDKYLRFGVYKVSVFLLAEHLLAVYMCDYSFIRKVAVNERTEEYHYKDIISVTTEEASTSYTLPDGQRLIKAQSFRLSVASGENIQLVTRAHRIVEMTRGELPATGAEAAVKVIRNMLREKKNA